MSERRGNTAPMAPVRRKHASPKVQRPTSAIDRRASGERMSGMTETTGTENTNSEEGSEIGSQPGTPNFKRRHSVQTNIVRNGVKDQGQKPAAVLSYKPPHHDKEKGQGPAAVLSYKPPPDKERSEEGLGLLAVESYKPPPDAIERKQGPEAVLSSDLYPATDNPDQPFPLPGDSRDRMASVDRPAPLLGANGAQVATLVQPFPLPGHRSTPVTALDQPAGLSEANGALPGTRRAEHPDQGNPDLGDALDKLSVKLDAILDHQVALEADVASVRRQLHEKLENDLGAVRHVLEVNLAGMSSRLGQIETHLGVLAERASVEPSFHPECTLIAANVCYRDDEDVVAKARDLIANGFEETAKVVRAMRGPFRDGKPGDIKIQLPAPQDKIRLLNARGNLEKTQAYRHVRVRDCQGEKVQELRVTGKLHVTVGGMEGGGGARNNTPKPGT